jgi:hypothetical protein
MYKADVILKELADGAPVLEPSTTLRAAMVDRYVSAASRNAGKALLAQLEGNMPSDQSDSNRGFRLWFDFVPQSADTHLTPLPPAPPGPRPRSLAATAGPSVELRRLMTSGGFWGTPDYDERIATLTSDDHTIDLSNIYPKMFVRIHDIAKHQDLEGNDPDLSELAQDVNRRIDRYAAAYPELQALLEVFRAYVAAVRISREGPLLCAKIRSIPLLDAERPAGLLPEHYSSEIFLTVAKYTYSTGQQRSQLTIKRDAVSGGVSFQGKLFYERALRPGQTRITQVIKSELAQFMPRVEWTGGSGHQFIALTVDSGELISELGDLRQFQVSSPADVLIRQEEARRAIEDRNPSSTSSNN